MAKFLPILVVLVIGGVSGFGLGYMTRGDGDDGHKRHSVADSVTLDDEREAAPARRDAERATPDIAAPPIDTDAFSNVDDAERQSVSRTFADPGEAHVGYDRDERVISLMAHGIGYDGTAEIVKERCTWLETIETGP